MIMMSNLTDEQKVLVAIVEDQGPVTPQEVEEMARRLSESGDTHYSGPKPDFTDKDTFSSVWNSIVTSNSIKQQGSTEDYRPLFVAESTYLKEICNEKLSELQSFTATISE